MKRRGILITARECQTKKQNTVIEEEEAYIKFAPENLDGKVHILLNKIHTLVENFLFSMEKNISKNPKSVETADIYEVWEEEEGRCLITSPEKNTKYENKK